MANLLGSGIVTTETTSRPLLLWSMAILTVGVVALTAWTVGWPMWQEHRALREFAAEFEKESADGYLRDRENNPPNPGLLICYGRNPMEQFEQAVGKLKKINDGNFAVPWLIERLRSADSVDRKLAATALGCIGPPAREAIAILVESLADDDSGVSFRAEMALARIGSEAVPALVEATRQETPRLRVGAFRALEWMGEGAAPAVPELKVTVRNRETREYALSVLASIGPHAALAMPEILEVLNDPDGYSRVKAAECVWKVNDDAPRALQTLIEILQNENPYVNCSVCLVLREMGDKASAAVPTLTSLLTRDAGVDGDCRWDVIETIGTIGVVAEGTVPILVHLLDDEDETISEAAAKAIGKLAVDSDEALRALVDAVQCDLPNVQFRAIWALGELGSRARVALPALKAVLENHDWDLAESVIIAIGSIDPTSVETSSLP